MIVLNVDAQTFATSERAAIQQVCDLAEPHIRALLPSLAPEIQLWVRAGAGVIPETGELGRALAPGHIGWTVDPARGVETVARSELRHTLFHECHHLVRGWVMQGGQPATSFMHGVVCEGLATAFERDASGRRPPWAEYPPNVRLWVDELLALPVDAGYQEWMFHHPDGRRWIGYRAGTFIANEAIRASGNSAAELATTPTDEILRRALGT